MVVSQDLDHTFLLELLQAPAELLGAAGVAGPGPENSSGAKRGIAG
jgi:hypothetical protein